MRFFKKKQPDEGRGRAGSGDAAGARPQPIANVLSEYIHRHDYYRDRATLFARAFILSVAFNGLALVVILVLVVSGREVLVVDMEGKTLPTLEESVVTRPRLLSFASEAIICPHNITFVRYARELEACSAAFTPAGWKSFEKSVIKAGYLVRLREEKAVSSAVATSPPVVVNETVHRGRRVWLIRMNIVVRVDAGGASRTQSNEVTVVVMRMPMTEHVEGIAISQYLAKRLS